MNNFCSNNPCFLAEESKTELQIPLIYQNPHSFYFPHEMTASPRIKQNLYTQRGEFRYESPSPCGKQRNRVSMRISNSWVNRQPNNQMYNSPQKQLCYQNKIKQNNVSIYLKEHIKNERPSKQKIYFNNQLVRSFSLEKQPKTAINSLYSSQMLNQSLERKSCANSSALDIVPKSQYRSLLQDHHEMKRIIDQEYCPLKNCYESLRQEQRERQKLIVVLQHKVRELRQKLNQRSAEAIEYSRY